MRFSELARHAVWLVLTDRDMIRRFIDGLTYQLWLVMTRERVSSASFHEVVDIAWQIKMVRSQEYGEREAKRPHGWGGFNGVASGAQSSSRAPSAQGSSVLDPSDSYSGSQGQPQYSPPFAGRGYFECGDLGHIKRNCPRLLGGPSWMRSQRATLTPVTSPPAQPARGGA
ncbi:uncharacterized protein [Nicotiana tomentosiformis]|uniref:uncharacterized protein n=1 Tax=Nicotiana tomentosiformis TaxID=4098 RepID=UPI00388C7A48